eukprot:gnl/TRDRNA2_/TRDRNA2_140079_c0_seq1.p1 gnl/TRDRNA2_/TRDRNA2_140079_c0~~gnl/TRDRNA2_/TRDRNA2_140079_c0_seq1.p1  ORF type:complete len:404 (-),score=31.63 gnl/TRDRNA2_/TRDRNA2_140079_c0_seq1:80-1291(-)
MLRLVDKLLGIREQHDVQLCSCGIFFSALLVVFGVDRLQVAVFKAAVPVDVLRHSAYLSSTSDSSSASCGSCEWFERYRRSMVNYEQFRKQNLSFHSWHSNLDPSLALIYDKWNRQHSLPSLGVAVLVVGQVRSGTSEDAIKSVRVNIIDELQQHWPGQVHVFAHLEFVDGGFADWQIRKSEKLNETNRYIKHISAVAVESMIRGYGAPYTLENAGLYSRWPNMTAAGCSAGSEPTSFGGGSVLGQYTKLHGAFEMMFERERATGKQFAKIVKIRPDIIVSKPLCFNFRSPMGIPVVCADGGGGGGDVLLSMDRWVAHALEDLWRAVAGCTLTGTRGCRFDVMRYCNRPSCTSNETVDLPNRISPTQFCGHVLWPWLWHNGVMLSRCGNWVAINRPGAPIVGR